MQQRRIANVSWLVPTLILAFAAWGPALVAAQADDTEPPAGASVSLDLGGDGGNSAGSSPLSRASSGIVLGAKVGGGIGTSDLGATFVLELELGYLLPFADRALELFVSGQYMQPKTEGTQGEPNPGLPEDGSFTYEITQQELAVTMGLLYRINIGSDLIMPYGGAGGRLYMLNTKASGEASGESFGDNEETQNDIGFVVIGGADFFIGPGALLAELSYGWAAIDGFIMRDTNVGQLNLTVGYRLML